MPIILFVFPEENWNCTKYKSQYNPSCIFWVLFQRGKDLEMWFKACTWTWLSTNAILRYSAIQLSLKLKSQVYIEHGNFIFLNTESLLIPQFWDTHIKSFTSLKGLLSFYLLYSWWVAVERTPGRSLLLGKKNYSWAERKDDSNLSEFIKSSIKTSLAREITKTQKWSHTQLCPT